MFISLQAAKDEQGNQLSILVKKSRPKHKKTHIRFTPVDRVKAAPVAEVEDESLLSEMALGGVDSKSPGSTGLNSESHLTPIR